MHFPTPHLKKSEKRKASIDSVAVDNDGAALERKATRRERKAKRAKAGKVDDEEDGVGMRDMTPPPMVLEDESIDRTTSPLSLRSSTSSQISPTTTRKDSAQEGPTTTNQDPPAVDEAEPPQPRRSSRIRNSMHSVANTWTKARPYLERLNGTIMPLHPQGVEAYYERDRARGGGVGVD